MPVRVRQSVVRLVATLLLVVGVPMAWVATATADAPTQAGWWFKLNAAPSDAPAAPVPAPAPVEVPTSPPNVPEGGLYIANDPTGPVAIAAVQLPANEGATGTLTLKAAEGGAGTPTIAACPAVGVWTAPEGGGAWAEAPAYDCNAGKAVGEVADDGTVTFALDSALAAPGGGFDVVLLPDPDSGTPFQTPFEAPGDDAWAPQGGTDPLAEGSNASTSDFSSEPASDAAGSESFDSGGAAAESGGGDFSTDFSAGDSGGSIDAGTPPVDAGTPPSEQPGAPITATGDEAAAAQPVADDNSGKERAIAIGLLVAMAAGLFWVSSRTGATGAGQAVAAGVGRFARPRAGRPNGLT